MEKENNGRVPGTLEEVERLFYMSTEYLTKFEIFLPVKQITLKDVLPRLISFFVELKVTEGMEEERGCTYSVPSSPSAFRGTWYNLTTKAQESEDVIWICACYNMKYVALKPQAIVEQTKKIIKIEGQELKAWVTYSSVATVQEGES